MRITVSQVRNRTPILDVGCGSGLISKLISTNLSYVGIDFNPNYLSSDWKGRRVDGRLLGNIMRLPFKSGAFRAVLLLHVIEHFPQQLQVPLLAEIYRVLGAGGVFVISTPNRGTWRNADKFLPPNNPKHFHCLRIGELRQLLQEFGFGKVRRHPYDIFLEYPHPMARLIPYAVRKAFASAFTTLDKWLVFTAVK